MSRIQFALRVPDLAASIAFHTTFFGTEPAELCDGYANFAIAEPQLKLVLVLVEGNAGEDARHRGESLAGEQAPGERSLLLYGHVHRGMALHRAARPCSACSRAARSSLSRSERRKSTASTTIMMGPPTNSAAVNCQLINRARITPSSTTGLVEAISKAIARP